MDRRAHWDRVYTTKREDEVSWFQADAAISRAMIEAAARPGARIIDVGGGASRLVDALVDRYEVTVLDVSEAALETARARLGERASRVTWCACDVTTFEADAPYDLWHDRAVFHFLTEEADRAAYVRAMKHALSEDGRTVIATFAPDGPERCSGLPVVRYDAASLARTLGMRLVEERRQEHRTPGGNAQAFTWVALAR